MLIHLISKSKKDICIQKYHHWLIYPCFYREKSNLICIYWILKRYFVSFPPSQPFSGYTMEYIQSKYFPKIFSSFVNHFFCVIFEILNSIMCDIGFIKISCHEILEVTFFVSIRDPLWFLFPYPNVLWNWVRSFTT